MARERNSRPSSCEEAYRRDKHTRESSGAFTEHYELHKVLASRKCAIPVRALNKGTDLLDVPSPVIRPDRPGRDDRTSTRHERAEARASSTSPYDKLLKHDKVRKCQADDGGLLEAFAKRTQALIEACRVIPERRVSRVHQVNLRMRHGRLVLIDDSGLDNRISTAVRNQHRLADLGQEVVVVERPREQPLTDMRRDRDVVTQHEIELGGRGFPRETEPQQAL